MKEDIEIIEGMIEVYRSCSVDEEGFDMRVDIAFMKKECKALENLLTRYKQLEKENEKLNQLKEKHNVRINDLCALVDNFAYNSIPVSLVTEKIEELNKLIIETQKELGSASKEYTIYVYQKNILQDLLERSREDETYS